jgi:chromosome segregation ATPase
MNYFQEEGVRLGEELTQLQSALNRERAALEQARADTARAQAEVSRAAERHAQTERDIQAMRAHRNPSVDTAAQTEVCGKYSTVKF